MENVINESTSSKTKKNHTTLNETEAIQEFSNVHRWPIIAISGNTALYRVKALFSCCGCKAATAPVLGRARARVQECASACALKIAQLRYET